MQNCEYTTTFPSIDIDLYLKDTWGDKICVFGFSRGAYTARALAGMVQKVYFVL